MGRAFWVKSPNVDEDGNDAFFRIIPDVMRIVDLPNGEKYIELGEIKVGRHDLRTRIQDQINRYSLSKNGLYDGHGNLLYGNTEVKYVTIASKKGRQNGKSNLSRELKNELSKKGIRTEDEDSESNFKKHARRERVVINRKKNRYVPRLPRNRIQLIEEIVRYLWNNVDIDIWEEKNHRKKRKTNINRIQESGVTKKFEYGIKASYYIRIKAKCEVLAKHIGVCVSPLQFVCRMAAPFDRLAWSIGCNEAASARVKQDRAIEVQGVETLNRSQAKLCDIESNII